MSHRFTAAVAAAFVTLTLPLGAQGFRYAPGTSTYDAAVVTKMTREIGGQRIDSEITQEQRLTVAVSEASRDTLRIGVTIDTAAVRSEAGPENVAQLIGLKVEGRISPVGEVYSSALTNGNLGPAGTVIASELAKILPRMRRDLRVGLAWTDTIAEEVDMLGLPIQRRTIMTSRVVGDTTVAGERGWRVDRKADVRFSGQGQLQGQQFTLTGASTAEGRIVVGRSGRYLASTQTDSVRTNFTSSGTEFSITQTQKTTVGLAP